jgi:hypothetical protein
MEVDYFKIFDEMKAKSQSPVGIVGISFYFHAKKLGKVDDTRTSYALPKLQNEDGIKDEDLPFARLAIISDSTLVSYDGPLKEKMGDRVQTPDQALQRL